MTRPILLPAAGLVSIILSILAEDWLAGVAMWILLAAWCYLRTPGGPPAIALAFTFQWVQVTLGIFYYGATGRTVPPMYLSDYRPMVMIGLGCLVALLAGLRMGLSLVAAEDKTSPDRPATIASWPVLVMAYLGMTMVTGTIQQLAWEMPGLTQSILALSVARLGLVFLIVRRLVQPKIRWGWIAVVVLGETALGFTGYFAGFREPLMFVVAAMLEVFESRKLRNWIPLTGMAVFMLVAGTTWLAVRPEHRRDLDAEVAASRTARLETIASLSAAWIHSDAEDLLNSVDVLIERLWAIHYPALAVTRVPDVVPHEDGRILLDALTHLVTPRLLFPDKADLRSDSEMVRHYAGVYVAGPEQGTSIAFGYAAEAYVDFGVPLMFIPVFAYGLLLGATHQWLLRMIWHRELAVAVAGVVLWESLYLFERSWARHLGLFLTLVISLGAATILLDGILLWTRRAVARRRRRTPTTPTLTSIH